VKRPVLYAGESRFIILKLINKVFYNYYIKIKKSKFLNTNFKIYNNFYERERKNYIALFLLRKLMFLTVLTTFVKPGTLQKINI
jgi:small-conductance mechanosensitive channel